MKNFSPVRRAWQEKKEQLLQLKLQIMDAMGISNDAGFYDFLNGYRRNISQEQQEKVAELLGKPAKELFPPEELIEG